MRKLAEEFRRELSYSEYFLDFSDGSCSIYLKDAQTFIFPDQRYRHLFRYWCVPVATENPDGFSSLAKICGLQDTAYLQSVKVELDALRAEKHMHDHSLYQKAMHAPRRSHVGISGWLLCHTENVIVSFDGLEQFDRFQELTNKSLTSHLPYGDVESDIHLSAANNRYTVTSRDEMTVHCATLDEAILCVHCHIDDLVAKMLDPLLIAHAGAVSYQGNGILIPGQGRAGKSSLVALLASTHCELINDDIVPIRNDGSLIPLGRSVKLRSPTWSYINSCVHRISGAESIEIASDTVKLLMFDEQDSGTAPFCRTVITPEFDPARPATIERMTAAEILKVLVDCNSLFRRPLSLSSLAIMNAWVDQLSGYHITYRNTEESLQLVNRIFESEFS